jgi:hypothetical protein
MNYNRHRVHKSRKPIQERNLNIVITIKPKQMEITRPPPNNKTI